MVLDDSTPVGFLYVTKREEALRFYVDKLGFGVRSDSFGDFLEFGAGLIRLTEMSEHTPSSHPVFGWSVPELRKTVAELRTRGVEFTIHPGMNQDSDGIWSSPGGETQVAFFSDPDGNVLSLSKSRSLTGV